MYVDLSRVNVSPLHDAGFTRDYPIDLTTMEELDETPAPATNIFPLPFHDSQADEAILVKWQDLAIRLDNWIMRGNAWSLVKTTILQFVNNRQADTLNLSRCGLLMLPPIFDMPDVVSRIRILSVAGNPIRQLSQEKLALLSNLAHLDISCTKISLLPSSTLLQPSLQTVWLKDTRVRHLAYQAEERTLEIIKRAPGMLKVFPILQTLPPLKIYTGYAQAPINRESVVLFRRLLSAIACPSSPDRKVCIPHKERSIHVTDMRVTKKAKLVPLLIKEQLLVAGE